MSNIFQLKIKRSLHFKISQPFPQIFIERNLGIGDA